MIKGAFIFASGLAAGTAYGFVQGARFTKILDHVVDRFLAEVDIQEIVNGTTVPTTNNVYVTPEASS